jgi:succinate dehydrogenase / fumarate reductase cytochrome b subunit
MTLSGKVGLAQGLGYKGGAPMWSWVLHRISGVGIVLFVGLHVLSSFFMDVVSSESDIPVIINTIYQSWAFQLFIYFCAIFHALNGLRIIVLDLWPKALQYQREITWLEWLTFIPIYGMGVYFILRNAFAGG